MPPSTTTTSSPLTPEELIKQSRPDEALAALQDLVRAKPADGKLRVFLFQLLAVQGQWERAMTQLNVAAEMDPATLLMAQVCRPALQSEVFRAEVFAGKRTPLVLGEPAEWIGWVIEAARLTATGRYPAACDLRAKAFEAAPETAGTIDGKPFAWIADADMRLGPMLEAIVDGRYYWVPFARLSGIELDKPKDLRDVVWMPARLKLANGGEKVALIPTRYPGSEAAKQGAVKLARTAEWNTGKDDAATGLGQRVLATDQGEHPLMQVRSIALKA